MPSGQEMLNITLRYVAADTESVMAFAPTPRIFGCHVVRAGGHAGRRRRGHAAHDGGPDRPRRDIGGSFYLPYRCMRDATRSPASTRNPPRSWRRSAAMIPISYSAMPSGPPIRGGPRLRTTPMQKLDTLQRIAVGYAVALLFAAALNYIPG